MRIALVVLFLLCGVGVFAESQPPSPTERERSEKTHHDTKNPDEKTNLLKQVAPFTAKIIPIDSQTQEITTETSSDKQNSESSEKWWRSADVWVAIFTAILAAITATLALFTYRLWVATKKMAKDTKNTAIKQSADTQEALKISRESTAITKESVDLARTEFNATHRPKIIIHTVQRSHREHGVVETVFTYVNIGTTTARIMEIEASIFLSDELMAPDNSAAEKFTDMRLVSGEKSAFLIKTNLTDSEVIFNDMKTGRGQSNRRLMCIGRIKYADNQGTPRETGFCRFYDASKGWLPEENSDYEYSY